MFIYPKSCAANLILVSNVVYSLVTLILVHYGHMYKNNAEKATRYNIFKENVAHINAFNSQSSKSYKLGVNQFANLTNDELKASRNRFKGHMCSPQAAGTRKKGAVTRYPCQGPRLVCEVVGGHSRQ
ncbi:hypothetical protein POTOM_028395 [Populus tomentosa]|uniref:Cathepsin propeptide inhibitor domain-containing protein n=1 Tax=Populus tomentosa TaxID=118781 RepID=A0A8X7ZED9_POPTO|nr:hypothetical protein POTOM_028395 [Populus tomentosa]